MVGATSSAEGVLVDFLIPILPMIGGELTREALLTYVCVSGHHYVECVQIMRWWSSNLGQ